jgi:anti-sigma factor RsiW
MVRLEESGTHLDESVLLRLIDGDGAARELAEWRAHVRTCEACSSRMHLLGRRSALVTDLLAELQLPPDFKRPAPPPPIPPWMGAGGPARPGWGTGWVRAAAVVVLLLVPLLAVRPLRAAANGWLSARWTEIAELVRGASGPARSAPTRPAEDVGATLWFTSAWPELRVEVAARQQAGALIVRVTSASEGSLQVMSGDGSEMPMISERGIRILNTRGSVASYELGVPSGVRSVIVTIGHDPPVAVHRSEIGAGRTLSLSDHGSR